MLSITAATVAPSTQFTVVITVLSTTVDPTTGIETTGPSTTVPVVTASYTDPGVTIKPEIGQVTISGQYKTIIKTTWHYLDLNRVQVTSDAAPDTGKFSMITKVDSPANLKETCVYTIDGETFTHTVDLVSYSGIGTLLKSLLATVA